MSWLRISALLMLVFLLPAAAAPGTFRGTVVRLENASWLYLKSANGGVRRVDVSAAQVFFSTSVPRKQRTTQPREALREGAELRVTAEQDGAGEWRALQVEILKLASSRRQTAMEALSNP